MRLFTITMLLLAALPFAAPAASAHDCNAGWGCGPCRYGEYHNHNDGHGQCSSGPGWYAENGWDGQRAEWGGSASNGREGQRFSPGTATAGTVLALAGAAVGLVLVRGRTH